MFYPFIILGDGASFDSVPEKHITGVIELRPPVSDSLLDIRFDGIIRRFPEVIDLTSSVMRDISPGTSLEDSLLRIQKRAQENSERSVQLVMFEFYLQELFTKISSPAGGFGGQTASNYRALIQEIKDGPNRAIVVNFIYDTVFEHDLNSGVSSTEHYIEGPIKVIKVHGSCDWRYIFRKDAAYEYVDRTEEDILRDNPLFLEGLRRIVNSVPHHI